MTIRTDSNSASASTASGERRTRSRMPNPIDRPRWRETVIVSIGVSLVSSLGYLLLTLAGPFRTTIPEVTFAVAGTMVALALPAAGLVAAPMTRLIEYWAGRLVDPSVENRQVVVAAGKNLLSEARSSARYAWLGSLNVVVALSLSSVAMLVPDVAVCGFTVPLSQSLSSLALGFLVMGSILFMVTARWIYGFNLVDRILTLSETDARPVQQQGGKPPPG